MVVKKKHQGETEPQGGSRAANSTWHGRILPGSPLWTDGWIITIGGLTGKPKGDPGAKPGQRMESPPGTEAKFRLAEEITDKKQ